MSRYLLVQRCREEWLLYVTWDDDGGGHSYVGGYGPALHACGCLP